MLKGKYIVLRKNFKKFIPLEGYISRTMAVAKYKIGYSSLRRYEKGQYYIPKLDCFTPKLEVFKFDGSKEVWYLEKQIKELERLKQILNQ